MLQIINNRDITMRQEAEKALQGMLQKYGKRYCPCSLFQTPDDICPCKDFRDNETEGICYCGRYEKVWIDD